MTRQLILHENLISCYLAPVVLFTENRCHHTLPFDLKPPFRAYYIADTVNFQLTNPQNSKVTHHGQNRLYR